MEREFAFKKSERLGHHPIYGALVKDNVSSFIRSESYLVITTSSLDFFKPKGNQLKESIPLLTISKLRDDGNTIQIIANKKSIKIDSVSKSEIIEMISQVLLRICTSSELKSIGVYDIGFSPVEYKSDGPKVRILQKCNQASIRLTETDIQYINSIINGNTQKLELQRFNYPSEMAEIIFDTLELLPQITEIVIPISGSNNMGETICRYSNEIARIKDVTLIGKDQNKISLFLQSLTASNTQIQTISFANSNLNESELRAISKFIINKKVSSIGLNSAVSLTSSSFFSTFFTVSLTETLESLNLDGTTQLDIQKISSFLPNIKNISLAGCNLNIVNVFEVFSKHRFLKSINISNNNCIGNVLSAPPPTCIQIICDNVKFSSGSIMSLIDLILISRAPVLNLSFNNIKSDFKYFSRVFDLFWKSKCNKVQSFFWNNNPIGPKLLGFLARQRYLTVSLDGCFKETAPEIFQFLIGLCNEGNVLNLSIRGNETAKIGRMFGSAIRAILSSKTIRSVDLSFNRIGDGGLQQLKGLSRHRTLESVAADGSFPSTVDTILELASQLPGFAYPSADIAELDSKHLLGSAHRKAISRLFFEAPSEKCPFKRTKCAKVFPPISDFVQRNVDAVKIVKRTRKAVKKLQIDQPSIEPRRIRPNSPRRPIASSTVSSKPIMQNESARSVAAQLRPKKKRSPAKAFASPAFDEEDDWDYNDVSLDLSDECDSPKSPGRFRRQNSYSEYDSYY